MLHDVQKKWYLLFYDCVSIAVIFTTTTNNNNLRLIMVKSKDKPLNLTHGIQHTTVCHAGQQ